MYELTGFQRDCLYVIAGMDSPKGVSIKAKLDEYYSDAIQYGRLYPNLDTLVEKGYVEKGQIDDRTNAYYLTDRGHNALQVHQKWKTKHLKTSPTEA